jgi:hypothetical protein
MTPSKRAAMTPGLPFLGEGVIHSAQCLRTFHRGNDTLRLFFYI